MALIKKGSRGGGVVTVQNALNKLFKSKLNSDGIFGSKTDKAVRGFQKKSKLGVDGVVGPNTLKKLKLTSKDLSGKTEKKVKLKKINISYSVPQYKQPAKMSCWAVAIAMMVSWKKRISISGETIAEVLGYQKEFTTNGMHAEDTKVFRAWGMGWEAPMCYSVQGFADMMKRSGPVWIAGNPNAPHVQVIVAMKGDGTPEKTIFTIHDPADGLRFNQSFKKAMGVMEAMITHPEHVKMKKPIYVAHF